MSKILILGEVWSDDDVAAGHAFAGTPGYILRQMLAQAGVTDYRLSSVLQVRPRPTMDLMNLCGTEAEGIVGLPRLFKSRTSYLRAEFAPELQRVRRECEAVNIVVAMGPLALWALSGMTNVKQARGAVDVSRFGVKFIPTYHPNTVMRDWTQRPIVIADLAKAGRESSTPEVTRLERRIRIAPTLADLAEFEKEFINHAERLSVDIETKGDQITCIGFATSPVEAMVIPFFSPTSNKSYWPTQEEELDAWAYVRRWCQRPAVFQNGLYDIHFLWRRYGIPVPQAIHDTMLLHHALQPEMEKGLGFLASVYTNEATWKFMRKADTIKKGE